MSPSKPAPRSSILILAVPDAHGIGCEQQPIDVQLGKVLAKRVLAHETDGALKAYSDLLDI